MRVLNQSVQEKINETSKLSLRYFKGLFEEALGDKFSDTVMTYLPLDEINWDAITFESTLAEFKGNLAAAAPEYLFNVIKTQVKKLANKVLKDLKACQPAKIKFAEAPSSTPFPNHIAIDNETNISLRVSFGQAFGLNKRMFEVAVYYLILPTGENQHG